MVPCFFVYFRRGALPTKKGVRRALLGDLVGSVRFGAVRLPATCHLQDADALCVAECATEPWSKAVLNITYPQLGASGKGAKARHATQEMVRNSQRERNHPSLQTTAEKSKNTSTSIAEPRAAIACCAV